MYRTGDPRFRRRLNELESTLERANEATQSGLYIFSQNYLKPCLDSLTACLTTCIDASCPSSHHRDRSRRRNGRAEVNFDFYDDWDDEGEVSGWGDDEFDRLVGAGGMGGGYGTVTSTQPGRTRGMSYPDGGDAAVIPGSSWFGKLFGGKALRYKPTAAGLKQTPRVGRGLVSEGEALLGELQDDESAKRRRRHGRNRSDTVGSGQTSDSYSSRGDIFPSDEEDDAIPLDDEFAMVLERRTTNPGFASAPETDEGSPSAKRGKRPSLGRRASSRRTVSSKSTRSSADKRRRSSGKSLESPAEEEHIASSEVKPEIVPEHAVPTSEEQTNDGPTATEETSASQTLTTSPPVERDEPSQLPTPSATDDEQDDGQQNNEPAAASKSNADP